MIHNTKIETMSKRPQSRPHPAEALLKTLGLPEEVSRRARDVYDMLEVSNCKHDKKKRIICYCVLQAYVQSGRPEIDMIEIGSRLNLTAADTKNAIANHPSYKQTTQLPERHVPIEEVLAKTMSERFNIDKDDVDAAVSDFKAFIAANPVMLTKQPHTVVAGYLMYWMMHNNYTVDDVEYASRFALHHGTIRTMFNAITEAAATTSVA